MDASKQLVHDLLIGGGSCKDVHRVHSIYQYYNSITQRWHYMVCLLEKDAVRFMSASIVQSRVILWNKSEGVTTEGHRFLEDTGGTNKEAYNESL